MSLLISVGLSYPPYMLPRYMLLDLPRKVIRSVACFRLYVHTRRVETATWNSTSPPTCDLCEADDNVQDSTVFQERNFGDTCKK